MGLAQSYRLLDWVDDRNYAVDYDIVERDTEGKTSVAAAEMFPRTMRHVLIQSYLIGALWTKLDPHVHAALRSAILRRYATRYARRHPHKEVTIEVQAGIRRLVQGDDASSLRRVRLMHFSVQAGSVTSFEEGF